MAILLEEEISICLEAVFAWHFIKIGKVSVVHFVNGDTDFGNYGERAHKVSPLRPPQAISCCYWQRLS